MFNMFLNSTLPNWVTSSFPVIQTILLILISLSAIAVLVACLLSPNDGSNGQNVITGKNESYYGYNKASTKEGRLHRIIVIGAILVFVFTILFFITVGIYNPAV